MTTFDLDTTDGINAALCAAADELYKLAEGQRVTVRKPDGRTSRMVVQRAFHVPAQDPHGRPVAGAVILGYGMASSPPLVITPYETALSGWTVTPADGTGKDG